MRGARRDEELPMALKQTLPVLAVLHALIVFALAGQGDSHRTAGKTCRLPGIEKANENCNNTRLLFEGSMEDRPNILRTENAIASRVAAPSEFALSFYAVLACYLHKH